MINTPASLRSDHWMLCVGISVCFQSESVPGFVGIRSSQESLEKRIRRSNDQTTDRRVGRFTSRRLAAAIQRLRQSGLSVQGNFPNQTRPVLSNQFYSAWKKAQASLSASKICRKFNSSWKTIVTLENSSMNGQPCRPSYPASVYAKNVKWCGMKTSQRKSRLSKPKSRGRREYS